MKSFDCDIAYGRGSTALPRELETPEALLAEMDHAGIDEALVWRRDALERGVESGNARLAELEAHPRLHGVRCFVPTCCDEMPSAEEFVRGLRGGGAPVVRAFPATHKFLLEPVACGDLLDLFVAYRIPLFLPLPEAPGGWSGVYRILRDFPHLTLVLTSTGCWGEDRLFRPLLKGYPRFFLTTNRLETAGQLESLVGALGFERLLFGSGLPFTSAGGSLLMIRRARISDDAREAVLSGNLRRLLEEVSR